VGKQRTDLNHRIDETYYELQKRLSDADSLLRRMASVTCAVTGLDWRLPVSVSCSRSSERSSHSSPDTLRAGRAGARAPLAAISRRAPDQCRCPADATAGQTGLRGYPPRAPARAGVTFDTGYCRVRSDL
jgi:hypothetical protein